MEELVEHLADAEHASWARWMTYLFSQCSHGAHGALIPKGLVERWQRQIETPYADLSEREKQSDRDEVALILPFIEEWQRQQTDPVREALVTALRQFQDDRGHFCFNATPCDANWIGSARNTKCSPWCRQARTALALTEGEAKDDGLHRHL